MFWSYTVDFLLITGRNVPSYKSIEDSGLKEDFPSDFL